MSSTPQAKVAKAQKESVMTPESVQGSGKPRKRSATKYPTAEERRKLGLIADDQNIYPSPRSIASEATNKIISDSPSKIVPVSSDSSPGSGQPASASQAPKSQPSHRRNRTPSQASDDILQGNDQDRGTGTEDTPQVNTQGQAHTELPAQGLPPSKQTDGTKSTRRVRFSPQFYTPPETLNLKPRAHTPAGADLVPEIPKSLLLQLLDGLMREPRQISLAEISGCFRTLQKCTEDFSRRWFGQSNTSSTEFPLHKLKEDYPALFYTTQYVLDASTTTGTTNDGWHKFFTEPALCHYLVFAILGEWFTERIFKHTAFGLNVKMQKYLAKYVDQDLLHHDAIVRSKLRSQSIRYHWNKDRSTAHKYLLKVSKIFAEELAAVLEPLIHSHISNDSQFERFLDELTQLVARCAGLHLSMLCTGEDGTIFVYPGSRGNGNVFHRDHENFRCVNSHILKSTSHNYGSNDPLVIKMTCWTRIEAYVPHGKDLLEMAETQERLADEFVNKKEQQLGCPLVQEQVSYLKDRFDWYDSAEGREFWDPFPQELQAPALRQIEKQDMMAKSVALQKKRKLETEVAEEDSDEATETNTSKRKFKLARTSRHIDEVSPFVNGEQDLRGAYITIYHCICPHVVYCERAHRPSDIDLINGDTLEPPHLRKVNTLAAAVAEARSNLRTCSFLIAKRQDLVRQTWDYYAQNSLYIEWGVFFTAIISGLAYHFNGLEFLSDLANMSKENIDALVKTVIQINPGEWTIPAHTKQHFKMAIRQASINAKKLLLKQELY